MNIAIQAADLDHDRIDGTRVYLRELLRRFGLSAPDHTFHIYHRREFNRALAPPSASNYRLHQKPFPVAWMQTRFVYELWKTRPDILFLPVQAVPWWIPRLTKVVVTVHDLAFKYYPETFPLWDRVKLTLLLLWAVRRADRIIAVSQSTKNDLLKFFPALNPERVRVIHHGFDREFFGERLTSEDLNEVLESRGLAPSRYLLFVGALQPRKNVTRLIQAFEEAKKHCPDIRLVLAGEAAWLSSPILEAAKESPYAEDIVLTGRVSFEELRALYQGARAFVFPSLYEGFGLPILEAFASGVPVIAAENSSLEEVAGDGALFFDATNIAQLTELLVQIWTDDSLKEALEKKGRERLEVFSWRRTAEDTLDALTYW